MKIIVRIFSLILMIAAPIISGKALYEYCGVKYFGHHPCYPFGKAIMQTIHIHKVSYFNSYENQMLSIGLAFLTISIIMYVSTFISAMIRLLGLAIAAIIIYYIFHLIK